MQPDGDKSYRSKMVLRERFDFDKWKTLHEHDPQKFEIKRRIYIEQIIATTSKRNQRRLKGIIFQVDAIRRRSSNPLKSCIEISQLMWDSFHELNDLLNDFNDAVNGRPALLPQENNSAQILEFKPIR